MNEQMVSAVLQSHGSEECIRFTKDKNCPSKEIGSDEILIRVEACALSTTDVSIRKGYLSDLGYKLPLIPGYEVSGIALAVGTDINHINANDEVAGLIPIDSHFGGCCEMTVQCAHNFFRKSKNISHEIGAACIAPGIRAYDTLHYAGRLVSGETVLIIGGASAYGHIIVQFAALWGGKVITTAQTNKEIDYLKELSIEFARIIDIRKENLVDAVMKETGGLGVDLIVETEVLDITAGNPSKGVTINTTDFGNNRTDIDKYENGHLYVEEKQTSVLSVADAANCIAVHGRWMTCRPGLQIDPPTSQMLWRKSALISYQFEQSWVLSSTERGRFLHILQDLLRKVEEERIQPKVSHTYKLSEICEAHREIEDCTDVGRIVIRIKSPAR